MRQRGDKQSDARRRQEGKHDLPERLLAQADVKARAEQHGMSMAGATILRTFPQLRSDRPGREVRGHRESQGVKLKIWMMLRCVFFSIPRKLHHNVGTAPIQQSAESPAYTSQKTGNPIGERSAVRRRRKRAAQTASEETDNQESAEN